METLQVVALAISAVAAIALLVAGWDIWKRRPFPGFEHGAVRVSGRRMKWVWGVALLGAFVAGGPEVTSLATTERSRTALVDPGATAAESPRVRQSSSWGVTLRLPAYSYSVSQARGNDGETVRTERVAAHIPIWLTLALVLYWFAAVRAGKP